MDPRKDINISGNRLVNVADPSLYHHVATKSYADALHARDPTTSEEEYIRYINLRNHTAHSIVVLCTLSWDWDWSTRDDIDKNTIGPHILLESTASTSLIHVEIQNLKDKVIAVAYKHPVLVKQWEIMVYFKGKRPQFESKYVWEASDDGEHYDVVSAPLDVEIKDLEWCGNDGYMLFRQNHHLGPHTHWRIVFPEGDIKEPFYANQIYMYVT